MGVWVCVLYQDIRSDPYSPTPNPSACALSLNPKPNSLHPKPHSLACKVLGSFLKFQSRLALYAPTAPTSKCPSPPTPLLRPHPPNNTYVGMNTAHPIPNGQTSKQTSAAGSGTRRGASADNGSWSNGQNTGPSAAAVFGSAALNNGHPSGHSNAHYVPVPISDQRGAGGDSNGFAGARRQASLGADHELAETPAPGPG